MFSATKSSVFEALQDVSMVNQARKTIYLVENSEKRPKLLYFDLVGVLI